MENRSLVIQVKSETEVASYDYIDVVREIELTTNRMDAPGKLVFSCVEQGPLKIFEGALLNMWWMEKSCLRDTFLPWSGPTMGRLPTRPMISCGI